MMDIEWWQIIIIMTVIVALILVPIVSWYVHRRLAKKQKRTAPPLMYITAVSANRTTDVDIPVLPSPSDPTFLPPSYEEICNGVDNQAYLSSSTALNIDRDGLPDYASVASQRSSVVLSTFYNDNASSARSVSGISDSDSETGSHRSEETSQHQDPVFSRDEMGVYTA